MTHCGETHDISCSEHLRTPLIAGLWYLPIAGALAAVSITQSSPAHEPSSTAPGACIHSAPPSGMRSSLHAVCSLSLIPEILSDPCRTAEEPLAHVCPCCAIQTCYRCALAQRRAPVGQAHPHLKSRCWEAAPADRILRYRRRPDASVRHSPSAAASTSSKPCHRESVGARLAARALQRRRCL